VRPRSGSGEDEALLLPSRLGEKKKATIEDYSKTK